MQAENKKLQREIKNLENEKSEHDNTNARLHNIIEQLEQGWVYVFIP